MTLEPVLPSVGADDNTELRLVAQARIISDETVGKGIVQQKLGHLQHARVPWDTQAIALQCARLACIAEFGTQFLKNFPVAIAVLGTELRSEMHAQVVLHPIVVEQRVVAVDQEHA